MVDDLVHELPHWFLWMLADHWNGLSRRDVVAGRPVVIPRSRVEVFLDDLPPARQPVSTAHGLTLLQIGRF